MCTQLAIIFLSISHKTNSARDSGQIRERSAEVLVENRTVSSVCTLMQPGGLFTGYMSLSLYIKLFSISVFTLDKHLTTVIHAHKVKESKEVPLQHMKVTGFIHVHQCQNVFERHKNPLCSVGGCCG